MRGADGASFSDARFSRRDDDREEDDEDEPDLDRDDDDLDPVLPLLDDLRRRELLLRLHHPLTFVL